MSTMLLSVATLSIASVNVNVYDWPLTTVSVAAIVGEVIVAVLQGSRTIISKVTVLVAEASPPSEFVMVLVKVTL